MPSTQYFPAFQANLVISMMLKGKSFPFTPKYERYRQLPIWQNAQGELCDEWVWFRRFSDIAKDDIGELVFIFYFGLEKSYLLVWFELICYCRYCNPVFLIFQFPFCSAISVCFHLSFPGQKTFFAECRLLAARWPSVHLCVHQSRLGAHRCWSCCFGYVTYICIDWSISNMNIFVCEMKKERERRSIYVNDVLTTVRSSIRASKLIGRSLLPRLLLWVWLISCENHEIIIYLFIHVFTICISDNA